MQIVMNPVSTFRSMRSRMSAFMLGALVLPATLAFAQPTPPSAPPAPADAPAAPKPPKNRSNITIIKDGEVVFSKSVDKNTMWRSLDDAINGELADSVKERVRTALKDAGKRVNISATGNTMTIVVDDENDKDGKNVVMSFSTDGVNRWGREFADTFRHHFNHDFARDFGREMRHFNFDASGLRDMAKRMRVMVAPHARAWNFNMDDDDDFTSEKAERLADEAKKMTREADALRKEADAMRLEAEAMKKRSEAVRLEAEARKKSPKSKDGAKDNPETSKDGESTQSAKKKKQD